MHAYLASNPALAAWLNQHYLQLELWQVRTLAMAAPYTSTLQQEAALRNTMLNALTTEFGVTTGQRLWRNNPQFRQRLKACAKQGGYLTLTPHLAHN